MSAYRYRIVDVFTECKMEGNPLSVFPDASGLDDRTMQKIAQEFNLSETAFILPSSRPACVARIRIFTPTREMLFAGHPTIGAGWVLVDEGVVGAAESQFLVEELVGAVPLRIDGNLLWLKTPPIHFGQQFAAKVCAEALGITEQDLIPGVSPQWVSAGNPNIYIAVRDRDVVDRASVAMAGIRALSGSAEPACIFVYSPTTDGAYSRMFAPELGVMEDPATGSATGPLAAYMMRNGLAASAAGTRLVSEQGVKMGRRSVLHILINSEGGVDGIEVGGAVTPLMSGVLEL